MSQERRNSLTENSEEEEAPAPLLINGLSDFEQQELQELMAAIENFTDLPTALMVTGVELSVFDSPSSKAEFERIFSQFSASGNVQFAFLRAFRRVRITYSSAECAVRAKISLNGVRLCGSQIQCFLAQVPVVNASGLSDSSGHLKLPEPVKQWLISPPSSPPDGWEPAKEAAPMVNYDLLNALYNMCDEDGVVRSGTYEVEPPAAGKPSIVIHICEEGADEPEPSQLSSTDSPDGAPLNDHAEWERREKQRRELKPKMRITHTSCPMRPTAAPPAPAAVPRPAPVAAPPAVVTRVTPAVAPSLAQATHSDAASKENISPTPETDRPASESALDDNQNTSSTKDSY